MALVFTAFVDQIANLQPAQRKTTSAFQNSVDGPGDSVRVWASSHRLSLARHGFFSKGSNLYAPPLQQGDCLIRNLDRKLHGYSICPIRSVSMTNRGRTQLSMT